MKAEKIVHWLAVAIVAILVLCVVCVIAALLYLLVINSVVEEWLAWLKFFGVVAVICGSAWAERYIQDHGWPWKSKKT